MNNKYNPDVHQRQSVRLKGYNYSSDGLYFVTICTWSRECYFEEYPDLRDIVNRRWRDIPNRYFGVELDEYIIMPNHVHGIIVLNNVNVVVATLAVAQDSRACAGNRAGARPAPTLGIIIGGFKSLCVNEWLRYIKRNNICAYGKFFQRNYYEHVIRNDNELGGIREYIVGNPTKWDENEDNPVNMNCRGEVVPHPNWGIYENKIDRAGEERC